MKFEEVLDDYIIDEWKEYYIEYRKLKNHLDKLRSKRTKQPIARVRSSFHWADAASLEKSQALLSKESSLDIEHVGKSLDSVSGPVHAGFELASPGTMDEIQIWRDRMINSIEKLEVFYQHKKQEIQGFFDYFTAAVTKIKEKDDQHGSHFMSELHDKKIMTAEQMSLRYGNKKIVSEIYTELLCLESFSIINKLGANLLIQMYVTKFGKEVRHDNIQEAFKLDKCEFTKADNLHGLKKQIANYVVKHITRGDKLAAHRILRKSNTLKMEELTKISFFLGVICTTIVVLLTIAWIQFKTDTTNTMSIFFKSFHVYRVVFCVQLSMWFLIIARRTLQMKHLNFSFVLNIRPSNMGDLQSLVKSQIYSTLFLVVALLLNVVFIAETIYKVISISVANFATLFLFLTFVIGVLTPSRSYLLDMKYAMGKLILQCFGSPFTKVAFIHILVADCLTSANKVILDLTNSVCWTYNGGWNNGPQDCGFSKSWQLFILAIPYIIRFNQCLKRYWTTKLVFPNLYNALKYSLSMATMVLGSLSSSNPSLEIPFIVIGFISFFYNNYWDNYNDWGLWKRFDGRKKFLRTKLTFAPSFYYTIIVLNFLLRINWMSSLMSDDTVTRYFKDKSLFTLVSEALEIIRRFLWAIIRVEHELFSNFENLREFWTVPSVLYIKNKTNKKKKKIADEDYDDDNFM